MKRVTPRVFLIGESAANLIGIKDYLAHIGADDWRSDAPTDSEYLMEFMGRLCYRSWKPGMNPNVSKVRAENLDYLQNIVVTKHGSVLEHPVTHWVVADISRIGTHELVRHRAGCAYSQESLRFVRLTDLGLWLPPEAESQPWLAQLFEQKFKDLEELQKQMAERLGLDDEGKKFKEKKVLTSMMRRLAPDGLATTIGCTFNFRALRHIIEMRTAESAESEIRLVFDQVARIAKARWPNIMKDYERNDKGEWVTPNRKV